MRSHLLAIGLAASALFASPVAAQTTLNVSTYAPYQHPLVSVALTQWAEDVEKETNGNVKINILQTPLGQPQALYDLAVNGVSDVILGVPGYTPGRFTGVEVAGIPQAGDSATALSVALWRTFEAHPEVQEELSQVQVLGLFTTSPMHFFNTERPINTMEDFEGLKTRVSGGTVAEVAKGLGVTPVLQPAGKAYELLSGGVVDATIFPRETMKSFNLGGLIKYGTIIPGGLSSTPLFLVMNKAKFEALSAEDQEGLMRASGEHLSRVNGAVWDSLDEEGIATLEAAGGVVETASPELVEQIAAASQPAIEQWAKEVNEATGADGMAILETFRSEAAAVEAE